MSRETTTEPLSATVAPRVRKHTAGFNFDVIIGTVNKLALHISDGMAGAPASCAPCPGAMPRPLLARDPTRWHAFRRFAGWAPSTARPRLETAINFQQPQCPSWVVLCFSHENRARGDRRARSSGGGRPRPCQNGKSQGFEGSLYHCRHSPKPL